ncbi:hypothetical protein [Candidatus Liberibacter solanacearum]|uniref:hypothetical protein n=1 Tax=Candidatus Liberibacter solanacearum TaxID=556287 RepID=UPI000AB89A43
MRAILARVLAQPFNFLVMDEPTNDLDFETLDFLEQTITRFQGTILIVSHDRDFLDRTVNSTLSMQNVDNYNGCWIKYAGGYSDMLLQQKQNNNIPQKKNPPTESLIPSTAKKDKKKKSLSYGQKLLLEKLPQEIKKIHLKITEKEQQFNDQNLFLKDAKKFSKLSHELKNLYHEIKEKEERIA